MSIRSLPTPRIIGASSASAARPFDRVDDGGGAQRGDDRRQVFHVGNLDIDHDLEEIGRAVGDLQIADIAALLADRGGQAAEIARLVGDGDVDAADMARLPLLAAPGYIEPALRLVGEAFERVAIDGVDGHALAGGDDADDAVAGQRVAATGKMQRHSGDQAADRDRGVLRPAFAARPRNRNDLVLRLGRMREGSVDDLASGDVPLADRDIEVLDRSAVELLHHGFERPLREVLAVLPERLLHDGAAEIEILGTLLRPDEPAYAGARFAGDDEALPGRGRLLRLRGDDLDLIAVRQLGAQRQQPAVDLRTDAGVADLRMHRVGKIHRRRAARQRDQIAFRGEGEDLVLEHLELGVLEEFLRPGSVVEDLQQLAQPAVLPALGVAAALLVDPMRGDPELIDLVHVAGADLHLDALPLRADHAGVQRAVVVRLRCGDEVFEAPGDDVIGGVDDPQRVIALPGIVDEHTESHDVGELLERDVLALHLAPDRIGRFLAAG